MNAKKWRLQLHRASSTISLIAFAMISALPLHGQDTPDTTKHTVQFVSVEENVKLEVLDWGGSGQPMIFLAGMGDTAQYTDRKEGREAQNAECSQDTLRLIADLPEADHSWVALLDAA
jgi:hypothetical protein